MLDIPIDLTEYTKDFTGRAWAFSTLAKWLGDRTAGRVYLLGGGTGSGKTAFAGRLVQFSRGEIVDPVPELNTSFIAYAHFCRANDDASLNPLDFVTRLSLAISRRYPAFAQALLHTDNPNIHVEANVRAGSVAEGGTVQGIVIQHLTLTNLSARIAFDQIVRKPLEQLSTSEMNAPSLVLVDALDEAQTLDPEQNIAALLAHVTDSESSLSSALRFVLTGRFHDPRLRALFRTPDLDLIDDAPSNHDDVLQYAISRLQARAGARTEVLAGKVATASRGNFLYARYVLDELLAQSQLPVNVDSIEFPDGLEAHYRRFIKRELAANNTKWEDRYSPILGLLAVAQSPGLTRQQLEAISGLSEPITDSTIKACAQYLGGHWPDGPFVIYHQSFREFLISDSDYSVFPDHAHHAIAAWYRGKATTIDWEHVDDYSLQHLVFHLSSAGRQDEIRSLLLDYRWLQAKLDATSLPALVRDFDYTDEDVELSLIRAALQMSSGTLANNKSQLPSLLYGHLISQKLRVPNIASLLSEIHDQPARPTLLHSWPVLDQAGSPLVRILSGHSNWVNAIDMTPDGRLAISGGGGVGGPVDNTLIVWDLATGEIIKTLQGHEHWIEAVAITPDGQYAVSAEAVSGAKNHIILWDLSKSEVISKWVGHGGEHIWAVDITADGRFVFSVGQDRGVKIWEVSLSTANESRGIVVYKGRIGVSASDVVAVTPDGRTAISGTTLYGLQVINLGQRESTWELRGHKDWISAVAITPDGRIAVTGSHRGDRTIKVWDLQRGELLNTLSDEEDDIISSIAISDDAKVIVSASRNYLCVWDREKGKLKGKLRGHGDAVTGVALSSEGRLACSCSSDRTVRLWDSSLLGETSKAVASIEKHDRAVGTLAVTADGSTAITASLDTKLKIWDLRHGRVVRTIPAHRVDAHAVSVTPDGKYAISGGEIDKLKIWNIDSGELVSEWKAHRSIYKSGIANNGDVVISAGGNEIKVWKLSTGQLIHEFSELPSTITCVVLAPTAQHIVSSALDGCIAIWDTLNGTLLRELRKSNSRVNTVALTPDGKHILSGGYDNQITIWDFETGRVIKEFTGHEGPVVTVSVSPDGRLALSGSHDKTIKVWDLEKGQLITTLVIDGAIYASAIVDNHTFLAAGESGRLHILELVGFIT